MIALGATVGALGFGLFALFKGGEFNVLYGNRAMHWRVILQGITLLFLFLYLTLGR